MSAVGDRITTLIAREFVAARSEGVRVVAITSTATMVAALAARRLGAPDLALAPGFGTLDADSGLSLSLGERSLRAGTSPVGPISDTFVAVARGMVGVVVLPAQLDARGATNLSFVGGTHDAPKVALPGSRGLPDNNDSPSRVWYLVADHSPRTLVDRVDFVSGPPPTRGQKRRLITKLGLFDLSVDQGWRAAGLFTGVSAGDVDAAGGFSIAVPPDTPAVAEPTDEELDVLRTVDPDDLHSIEFDGKEGAVRMGEIVAKERSREL